MTHSHGQDTSNIPCVRRRAGCLNCRKRRKKCDEQRPSCSRCLRLHDDCLWRPEYSFQVDSIDAEHPSMLEASSRKRAGSNTGLKIIDITFSPTGSKRTRRRSNGTEDRIVSEAEPKTRADSHHKPGPETESSPSEVRSDSLPAARDSISMNLKVQGQSALLSNIEDRHTPRSENDIISGRELSVPHGLHPPVCLESYQPFSMSPERECLSTTLSRSENTSVRNASMSTSPPHTDAVFETVDLDVLDYLASYPSNLDILTPSSRIDSTKHAEKQQSGTLKPRSPAGVNSVAEGSPDSYLQYYPDVAFSELHSQLHNHIVEATRDVALTSHKSPALSAETEAQVRLRAPVSPEAPSNPAGGLRLLASSHISPKRAIELWQNYLDEVAPWLDMFDNSKQWQTTVAHMAQHVDFLQYSLLALSARQQEQRGQGRPHTESLSLYQEAIRLIAVQLSSLRTEIIAAVILLCVLEMMSSSPRVWAKHLDGCAMLFEAAGINGVVGGVREVLFWTFARMDVYKAVINDTSTNLTMNRWFISTDSMSDAVRFLKGRPGSDNYANYVVFLCGGAVNIVSNNEWTPTSTAQEGYRTFVSRWRALYDLLEGWYDDRPDEMKPLMTLPTSGDDLQSPFDTILFSTPPGISGNQLYHASMILLLQDKPKEVQIPKSHKSMLWHARRICGISLSNRDHGALIHGVQPIWIAGKLMSHPSEHKIILNFLKSLQRETGWATAWRVEDLKDFWGMCDGGG